MISIKSKREIDLMISAGRIVYETHQYVKPLIKPGVSLLEIDAAAESFILSKGAEPSFKGYDGFPNATCISVNEEVVHGIPSKRKLKDGDIVSIDIGADYKGYHGDSAWSYPVGKLSDDKKYLMEHTEKALFEGIKQVKPGNRVGDVGNAVECYANAHNLGIVRELCGHGVGNHLHEEPDVPNYGEAHTGPVLKEGMVIAIEPMLNLGTDDVVIEDNDWTITTLDKKPSAHFEHTVLVTKDGYQILTGE
ncbi:MAG: type I methionyl aminopeptidase [Bacilli bacterium]|nr:type I methionyl aminopeptidase [Bacilli bacterium]